MCASDGECPQDQDHEWHDGGRDDNDLGHNIDGADKSLKSLTILRDDSGKGKDGRQRVMIKDP